MSDLAKLPTAPVADDVLWALAPAYSHGAKAAASGEERKSQAAAKLSLAGGRSSKAKNVAVVSISGVMTKYGSDYSPDGSMAGVGSQIKASAADETVGSIILVIDSPGGTVAGSGDLAEVVRQAAAQKPVMAFIEDLCCSAAYRVAAQATEIHANRPEAVVGSIGTYMVVYDASRLFQNAGIEANVFATGKYKGAGVMGTAISDDQKAKWQSLVDDMQQTFAADIMAGRDMTAQQVEALADGSVWLAQAALQLNLIDAVSSFDQVVGRASSAASPMKKGRTMSAELDSMPKAALLQELEAALPGASAEFTLRQLKAGATLARAQQAFMDERKIELDQRETALKAKEEAVEKREKAVADQEQKLKAAKGGGLPTVREPVNPGASSEGGDGSAESQFKALVAEKVESGIPRERAVAAVVRENPDLQLRMAQEAKPYDPPRT